MQLEKISSFLFRIPKTYKKGMLVDGLIFSNDHLIEDIKKDKSAEQVANVAMLPGIQKASLAMPDIHWGYGFCIGGVCATDPNEGGVVSPGGVGYDINCGVRLVKTNILTHDIKKNLRKITEQLFKEIPTGAGVTGSYVFNKKELKTLMQLGPKHLVNHYGWGVDKDVLYCESGGALENANPDKVSEVAFERGKEQCGTLGSGNHFLEVQSVQKIFDNEIAKAWGLFENQVVVMIHSGSRGLGHQVCTDYLNAFKNVPQKYGIYLPDRQLACAPILSPEGKQYLGAMRCAANYAWNNRQCLMHLARQVFEKFFGRSWQELGMSLVYDVAHNIAKFETYNINGKEKKLLIHRKGATRAFPKNHPELSDAYKNFGQPVIIPGSMGTASWIMVGQPQSLEMTFGTTCHGAGRRMSRQSAIKDALQRSGGKSLEKLISQELEEVGVIALAKSRRELAEEQPKAYKNVDDVVSIVEQAALAKKVARLTTLGVIKG